MELQHKHSATGTTIFTVMSTLASTYRAINLSQGFPDFPIDEKLAEYLSDAAKGNYNQYAPMTGLPALRQAIADDLLTRYHINVHPDEEITITPGATYGIYAALTSFLQRDDEVIILEPAYDSYIPGIEMNGATPVCVPLTSPDFSVDWERVKASVTSKTRAIIVNTPNNPTGATFNKKDWEELAALVRNTDIIIISDEVYEQLVFDGKKHLSALEHPELRERSFVVFSFGKVFNNTGWKIGYVIATKKLTHSFRHVHQFISFSVNTPAQYAIAEYLKLPVRPDVTSIMEQKRDLFLSLMEKLPFTVHQKTSGSYFQILGYEQISDLSDLEFAKWLTAEYGVATIPVSAFYSNRKDNRLIRFCFAKKDETLTEAVNRLSGLMSGASTISNI
jgi:methionine aminotransferase